MTASSRGGVCSLNAFVVSWLHVSGIVYGMGPGLLAQKLGLTLRDASTLMRSFSSRYPLIKRWEHHVRQPTFRHTVSIHLKSADLHGFAARFYWSCVHADPELCPSMLGIAYPFQEKAAPPRFALENWSQESSG